jgi:hypothetical protein
MIKLTFTVLPKTLKMGQTSDPETLVMLCESWKKKWAQNSQFGFVFLYLSR